MTSREESAAALIPSVLTGIGAAFKPENYMNPVTEPKIDPAKNSFVKTLADLQRGGTLTELSEQLAEVVKGVIKWGKKGELTLSLKVRRNADGESVEIIDDISAKIPRKDRKASNFFTLEDGQLTRNDPAQSELGFLKVIDGDVKDAPEAAPAAAVNG